MAEEESDEEADSRRPMIAKRVVLLIFAAAIVWTQLVEEAEVMPHHETGILQVNETTKEETVHTPLKLNGTNATIDHKNISIPDPPLLATNTTTDDDRPRFVLHIGPPKTGTTDIQTKTYKWDFRKLIRQDHFVVLLKNQIFGPEFYGTDFYKEAKSTSSSTASYSFPDNFLKVVNQQQQKGENVFGSSEYLLDLKPAMCDLWKKHILPNFHLEVVMVYRRLHSYLPSLWNQHFKFYRGQNGNPVHKGHYDWPGIRGDVRIQTFEEWFLQGFYSRTNKSHAVQKGYEAWKDCSHDISMVSLHQPGDLLTNFVCQALQANHTCQALRKKHRRRRMKANPSMDLNFDILAVAVHEQGLIGSGWKRPQVIQKIQGFMNKTRQLPLQCPNATILDSLYQWSWKSEVWAFDFMKGSDLSQAAFDEDWNKSIQANTFCAVNVTAVLEQPEWKAFFETSFPNRTWHGSN